MARPKRVDVSGQVYIRRLTAGQSRDNERQLTLRREAYIAAEADSAEEKAAEEALWQAILHIVRECVIGCEDEDGEQVLFDAEVPIEDQIDGSDLQELALHCCGNPREAVRVIGQAPLAT